METLNATNCCPPIAGVDKRMRSLEHEIGLRETKREIQKSAFSARCSSPSFNYVRRLFQTLPTVDPTPNPTPDPTFQTDQPIRRQPNGPDQPHKREQDQPTKQNQPNQPISSTCQVNQTNLTSRLADRPDPDASKQTKKCEGEGGGELWRIFQGYLTESELGVSTWESGFF